MEVRPMAENGKPPCAAPTKIVVIYAERTVLHNGDVVMRALRTVDGGDDMIDTTTAAALVGIGRRAMAWRCERGYYASAIRKGPVDNCHWLVSRSEVLRKRNEPGQ
jgi:hypothetical protein